MKVSVFPGEIVRTLEIMDASAELNNKLIQISGVIAEITAEITTELTGRKKQYNHYRDRLLSFKDNKAERKTLEEITTSIIPGHNKARSTVGTIPVYGATGIIGATEAARYSGDALLVVRGGTTAGLVYAASGDFDVSNDMLIINPINAWDMRFAFHQLTYMNLNQYAAGVSRPLLTEGILKALEAPFPPLKEQVRIAAILDTFDTLITSITEGLSREIELRQKQYAYYRDLLPSTHEPAVMHNENTEAIERRKIYQQRRKTLSVHGGDVRRIRVAD